MKSDSIAHAAPRRQLLVGAVAALALLSGPLLAVGFVSALGSTKTAAAADYDDFVLLP